MEIDINELKFEDKLALKLKALYRSYGYSEYRLTGFEDYSLYSENKSFLDCNGVLTFTSNGRLMALRPDVTLSIVKGLDISETAVKKLFYDETVYRKSTYNFEFNELRQVGVEVIGDIDRVSQAEVYELLLNTLFSVEKNYVVDISHAGIIQKLLSGMNLSGALKAKAAECLERKCAHDFLKLDIPDGKHKDAFCSLIDLPQYPEKAMAELCKISHKVGIDNELEELNEFVNIGGDKINIDFSIGGDAEYYNGVVFKGYIDGVPYAVLSGGRYDKLLNKFGKNAKALGFALYIGKIIEYYGNEQNAPDIMIVYNDNTVQNAIIQANKFRRTGKKVLLSRDPCGFTGKIIYAEVGK